VIEWFLGRNSVSSSKKEVGEWPLKGGGGGSGSKKEWVALGRE
jgi:hypothetical protein